MPSLTWTGEWVEARSVSDLLSWAPQACVLQTSDFNHTAGLLLAAGHPPEEREASGSCLNWTPGSAEDSTPCVWHARIGLCSAGGRCLGPQPHRWCTWGWCTWGWCMWGMVRLPSWVPRPLSVWRLFLRGFVGWGKDLRDSGAHRRILYLGCSERVLSGRTHSLPGVLGTPQGSRALTPGPEVTPSPPTWLRIPISLVGPLFPQPAETLHPQWFQPIPQAWVNISLRWV